MRQCVANAHATDREWSAGRPVDRDEWYMTPQTVNAYYNPTQNEIVSRRDPQPLVLRHRGRRRRELGAIGAVIGHEIDTA